MNGIAVIDARRLASSAEERGRLAEACTDPGVFYLDHPPVTAGLTDAVLAQARSFFALPRDVKDQVAIERSPHFRGYSEMINARDWREQMHFGPETVTISGRDEYRLLGPNLWPDPPGEPFRRVMLGYLREAERLGLMLLEALGEALGVAHGHFAALSRPVPYTVMKLIAYHPQPSAAARSGVAAHCDWSWLTILLQDAPGLKVMTREGRWLDVPPRPGAVSVNTGELLELISGGQFRAAPHRVVNLSREQSRLSVPVFINPSLDALVEPRPAAGTVTEAGGHVHRVAGPGMFQSPFRFGESEWRRKGLGRWCYDGACLGKG